MDKTTGGAARLDCEWGAIYTHGPAEGGSTVVLVGENCPMSSASASSRDGTSSTTSGPCRATAGNALRLLATVGAPIAIATGQLFYFGWVRASVQARRLGYDTAIPGWSVQDSILRSILILFIPLMMLAAPLSGIIVSAAVTLALLARNTPPRSRPTRDSSWP